MKLGSQTGSVVNHILSRATIGEPKPEIGMGATLLSWTDRHAATIIGVFTSTGIVKVQVDKATRTDKNGISESQTYDYAPDPQGAVHTFRKTKSGAWREVEFNNLTNRYRLVEGYGLRIGERREYRDFSF